MTEKRTPEYAADIAGLKNEIDRLSPPQQLRLAADLIEMGKLPLAEAIAARVANELKTLRILGKAT